MLYKSCFTHAKYYLCYNPLTKLYYMTSSVSGQDEPNRALIGYPSGQRWSYLARSGLLAWKQIKVTFWCFKSYNKSFIYQACLVNFVSVHKHAKKELGQYPAILTSRLFNNPYIFIKIIRIVCALSLVNSFV